MILLEPSMGAALAAGDKAAVLAALQQAIQLEHSTIPPYLYALYSLVPGRNDAVAAIIDSVVVEEMLHLTLAANVVNALGGAPVLDGPELLPSYPAPLPGAVGDGLVVPLAPCSVDLVRTVFAEIEQPEEPQDYKVSLAPEAVEGPLTIGTFYRRIKEQVAALGDGAFAPGPRNQMGPDRMDQAIVVDDVATASQAIDTIIDQGEGTATEPLEVVGAGYAHYYRFCEIVKGGLLVPNADAGPDAPPDERYTYDATHHPVRFDAQGVYPAPTNPRAATYPAGSIGQVANDTFNYTYTGLLKVLHDAVNGRPPLLDDALGLMMSLKQQAMDMMSGTCTGGESIGPSFEYQLVNPGP